MDPYDIDVYNYNMLRKRNQMLKSIICMLCFIGSFILWIILLTFLNDKSHESQTTTQPSNSTFLSMVSTTPYYLNTSSNSTL